MSSAPVLTWPAAASGDTSTEVVKACLFAIGRPPSLLGVMRAARFLVKEFQHLNRIDAGFACIDAATATYTKHAAVLFLEAVAACDTCDGARAHVRSGGNYDRLQRLRTGDSCSNPTRAHARRSCRRRQARRRYRSTCTWGTPKRTRCNSDNANPDVSAQNGSE